ncbi:MAG: mercuric reductase [Gemmataceae bacterium]|nr:mercuric reductase [Gemmataceae bacterium]
MSATPESYDAVILGTGQAGKPLALALAQAGWKTAVVEQGHVGGTCINVGCTPTKTMVASARVAYLARRAADYGVHAGPVSVDLAAVRRRKQAVVESFRGGSERRLETAPGLTFIRGEARFTGPRTIQVVRDGAEPLQFGAGKVFINTGGRPALPDLPGPDSVPLHTSTSIMELDELPSHLVILGGGYIGLEFGQMFRRFGSSVTVIHRGDRLLTREDPDVADEVAKILREDGVEVLLRGELLACERPDSRAMKLRVRSREGEYTLTGSHLLAAVGRVPNTDRLNLKAAGVATDERGFIQVNERLETNVEGVYALGDCNGGPAFTHISYDDYRIVRANLLDNANLTTTGRIVPYTVFLDPQLGRVGLTEQQARAGGHKVLVARMPMTWVARALEMDEARGFMKVVVDADSEQILGAAILGIEGGEVMAMLEIAMMGRLPYPRLREGIFAHPTLAESLNNLFGTFQAD